MATTVLLPAAVPSLGSALPPATRLVLLVVRLVLLGAAALLCRLPFGLP
ncbi:hypothetical protein [Bifidobacterium sp. ESL0790]|nr:hypothetical protein [Bifidobacterium sp. ESL0790]WEV72430.1 hypothetical protein OZY47_00045 [Bifidobacterium sp. ESL0790]